MLELWEMEKGRAAWDDFKAKITVKCSLVPGLLCHKPPGNIT